MSDWGGTLAEVVMLILVPPHRNRTGNIDSFITLTSPLFLITGRTLTFISSFQNLELLMPWIDGLQRNSMLSSSEWSKKWFSLVTMILPSPSKGLISKSSHLFLRYNFLKITLSPLHQKPFLRRIHYLIFFCGSVSLWVTSLSEHFWKHLL